ncbi:methylated-DNA--[protein]-cysteine S-methyltransferase [Sphingosinicella sp. BN140058]|uniref:methylated-DNA--[protein]-cysteine S-methyltransferase n=1 Tax=Sphingosinicella sp. BN140058 TaxID=1892855 RepID=UPI00101164BE|nr:methylated-DNA--[protein]-cysteine S-methyltransferase [Sphingosinicella sp. BN140058]QAY78216.1 methylated-DNA--[protein]-cysteine S-methyltransferase [Sphingosinicella sp. BN140058]
MATATIESRAVLRTVPPGGLLFLDRISSPMGLLLLVHDAAGCVRALDFDDYGPRMRRLLERHYGAVESREAPVPAAIRAALDAYFARDFAALDNIPVAASGSEFQHRVWSALLRIGPGETWSYGRLAAAIGAPAASRAVGLANGANPIAVIVPCHRVIGANGTLTGYGGGLDRKRWLLQHEETNLFS